MNKLYAENKEDNVFGEIAMLDPQLVKRTANVISIDKVTVLALTKVGSFKTSPHNKTCISNA